MIQSMSEWHGEEDQTYWKNNKNWNASKLIHEVYFEDVIFKEIQYLKKYTEDSLMGNVGGIIGKMEILINDMFFKTSFIFLSLIYLLNPATKFCVITFFRNFSWVHNFANTLDHLDCYNGVVQKCSLQRQKSGRWRKRRRRFQSFNVYEKS